MAGDATTIARPYAEAVFAHADEAGKLELWTEMLEFLAAVVKDPSMAAIVANPLFDRADLTSLMLDVGGGRLTDEAANLVKLLIRNGRLKVVPEILEHFGQLKAEKDRILNVHVRSAFALSAAQKKVIAESLKSKLGREVTITSEKDADLIGGVHIRAGDLVIDGSIQGRLQQLAHELGI